MILARARPLDSAELLEPAVAHAAVHRAERPQLVPDLLERGMAPVVTEAPGQLGRGSSDRRGPGRADRAPCASAAPVARCWSRCRPRPRTTRPTAGSTTSAISQVFVIRMSWTIRKSSPSSSSSAFFESASDCAGFSPITYSVRSSPRSIASNICDRCQPRLGGERDAPRRLEPGAGVVIVLDVLEARQLVGDRAHVAAALDVVLTAQRVQARAVAPDVPGQQREVDQRQDVVDRGDVLGDPERPAQDRPVGARVGVRQLANRLRGNAGDALALLERPRLDRGAEVLEARRRVIDEVLVGQAGVDDLAGDRVGQRDVGADVQPEPGVGPLRRARCAAGRRRTATRRDGLP